MTVYESRFWRKSWDPEVTDLAPDEYETTYVDLLKQTIADFPTNTALAFMGTKVSFLELDRYANQFANVLIANGFERGDIVGINLPNIPEYLIAVVGTLRAGCIVSGVSPLLSIPQMRYQLSDLACAGRRVGLVTLDTSFARSVRQIAPDVPGLSLIVTTSVAGFLSPLKRTLGILAKKIPSGQVTPLPDKTTLDFHKDILRRCSTLAPGVKVTPDDIGYIQYTGGTTGPPKGAMLSNRNAASNMLSILKWLGWQRGGGCLLSAFPMFHIAGLKLAESAVYAGWTQVLIPNPRDVDHISREMKKYAVTHLVNVPALYQLLMANPAFRKMNHSRLQVCVSGASPFPRESQEQLETIVGKGKILELYGMTETSPVTAMNPSKGPRRLGTVGLPILNVDLKLIEPRTGDEVAVGEAGEICVRGPLVMQGYYNKPDETKKAIDADGYLHTGDVGIMDEDGYLRLVDRTKDMIDVGGYKVFSTKVEEALARHPAVASIALIGAPNPERPGSEVVHAFVQPHAGSNWKGSEAALKEDLLRFAKETCAPYEVPKVIQIVKKMPLTAVGKIDKKVLRGGS